VALQRFANDTGIQEVSTMSAGIRYVALALGSLLLTESFSQTNAPTLALELLENYAAAIDVYERLREQRPQDVVIQSRLEWLRSQ
jgi:hypothetical protein